MISLHLNDSASTTTVSQHSEHLLLRVFMNCRRALTLAHIARTKKSFAPIAERAARRIKMTVEPHASHLNELQVFQCNAYASIQAVRDSVIYLTDHIQRIAKTIALYNVICGCTRYPSCYEQLTRLTNEKRGLCRDNGTMCRGSYNDGYYALHDRIFANYGFYALLLDDTTAVCKCVASVLADPVPSGLADIHVEMKDACDVLLAADAAMRAHPCTCRFPGDTDRCTACPTALMRPMHKFVLAAMNVAATF